MNILSIKLGYMSNLHSNQYSSKKANRTKPSSIFNVNSYNLNFKGKTNIELQKNAKLKVNALADIAIKQFGPIRTPCPPIGFPVGVPGIIVAMFLDGTFTNAELEKTINDVIKNDVTEKTVDNVILNS